MEQLVTAPMHLLEPGRFVKDEGLGRTFGFLWKVARNPAARRRILSMRRVFRKYAGNIGAIAITAAREDSAQPL